MQHQISFQDLLFGKTFPEPSAAIKEQTSEQFSKPSAKLKTAMLMFLNLTGGGGSLPGASWEMVTALPGVYMTLSIGEFPSVARESTLSQILDLNAPEKYSLSSKAKAGILRRAKKRGKELPDMLRDALLEGLTAEQLKEVEDAVCETEEKERLEMKDGVITMSDNMPSDEMPPYEE